MAGHVSARAARSGTLWGLIFAVYVVVQILAYTSSYPTQAARDQLEAAFGSNIGLNALIGPARDINTVAGYSSWRIVGILSLLGAVWGLLTATRLLRGEEDAGRTELFVVGQTTRKHAAMQSQLGLGAALLTLFVLTSVGTVVTGRAASVGFTVAQSLYFSLVLVSGAAMFLAIGALTSQLAGTRRRAASIAGVVFGVAYALRMVADSAAGLHWIVWLSPLGWIEQARPLSDPNPLALVPAAVLVIVATFVSVHLAGTRDVGSATLPDHDTSAPHLALLAGPLTLAARLTRPATLGWLFAVLAFSVLIGTVALSATRDAHGELAIRQAIGRIGGHGSAVTAYLGLTFLVLAFMIALIAASQVAAICTEEAEGRLENLLVRPVGRIPWLGKRLALAAAVLTTAAVLGGTGAWVGAASQHSGIRFGTLLAAGLNVIPPSLLLLGLGSLAFGVRPASASGVAYGYLTWSFLLEFLGAVVHANHWLMDTSIFFHMVPAPATAPNWASAAIMGALAAAAAAVGAAFLNRRDITNS